LYVGVTMDIVGRVGKTIMYLSCLFKECFKYCATNI
jgi:hypothetical protein